MATLHRQLFIPLIKARSAGLRLVTGRMQVSQRFPTSEAHDNLIWALFLLGTQQQPCVRRRQYMLTSVHQRRMAVCHKCVFQAQTMRGSSVVPV